jgi:uncharacterized phiE125 gp8 family phage protein
MRVRLITPAQPVVTWAEADAHLKLDGDTSQQAFVEGLVAVATNHIDGPQGWLGRALGVQTLEARGESFWAAGYRLPYPPHIDVLSVKYVDGDGSLQTLDPSAYALDDREVVPAHGTAWPSPRASRASVQLRYRAGYVVNPAAAPLVANVPAAIKAAILLMVGDLHRYRETAVAGTIAGAIPMSTTVENLLAPYRVFA